MHFFDFYFWQDFVSNSLATVLGIVLGIPAAFWIDRLLQKKQETGNRIELLQLMSDTLEKNHKLLIKIEEDLKPGYVFFYNVDTLLLDATSSLKYEILDNIKLNQLLDSVRYELLHLHRKVNLQIEISFSTFRAMDDYMETRAGLVHNILANVPEVKSEISKALELISVELENL
jgi:hypothetical protein